MNNNSSQNYKDVLALLSKCNRKELEDIRRQCAGFIQFRSSKGPAPVEEEDWLLLGILSELKRRGLYDRPFHIKKPSSNAGFQTQSENVRALLLQAAPGLSAIQYRALGQMAAYELASFISSWQTHNEINRDTLLNHISRVPEAIDNAFPGYMAAGMLGLVIR